MVNPIASSTASIAASPLTAEPNWAAALPDAARQVTATNEAHSATTSTNSQKQQPADENMPDPMAKALEQINNSMEAWATGMRFNVDPEAQRVVVSIVDSATGEVLRTVPSDAVIRVAKMIVQLQGKSINTTA